MSARAESSAHDGFELQVQDRGAPARSLYIGAAGQGCQEISSALLQSSCRLATLTDPATIAASARGRMNFGDVPAFEAVVWRATLSGDANTCGAAGLITEHLDACARAATIGTYSTSDDGVRVTVTRRLAGSHVQTGG